MKLHAFAIQSFLFTCGAFVLASASTLNAHEHTLQHFLQAQAKKNPSQNNRGTASSASDEQRPMCHLKIRLTDAGNQQPIAGLVRLTDLSTNQLLEISELISREAGWHALEPAITIRLPRTRLKVEAMRGLSSELAVQELDLSNKTQADIKIPLKKFFDPHDRGLINGNTHLHLRRLTHAEAIRYLRVVPAADDLDLVFLSHLRRIPDERTYISNSIVENSLAGGELQRLSQEGTLLRPGQEHRHNFTGFGEGYGHVMFLDIAKLIRPVSIGPGIMKSGTDGIPLRRGIHEARKDQATVVWCHNENGMEDIPNWLAGTIHALNIYDGGRRGSYRDSFYRYLNIGLRVPFSTGTDWFIFDFSRVYVPLEGDLTSRKWLDQLTQGRSFITNGPFLELTVNGRGVGDTIDLQGAGQVHIRGRAVGRADFRAIELIHNGQVVSTIDAQPGEKHFHAKLDQQLQIDEPGWIALRIPLDAGQNLFGKDLYAHTSPVYVTLNGDSIFQPEVARAMLSEVSGSMEQIEAKGLFADPSERRAVLSVYDQAKEDLRKLIRIEEFRQRVRRKN